jgi:hypothetical protein
MASAAQHSKFIGRVGALAIALGIGSAIAAPQVAWADEGQQDRTPAAASDTVETSPEPSTDPSPGVDPAPDAGLGAEDEDEDVAGAEDANDELGDDELDNDELGDDELGDDELDNDGTDLVTEEQELDEEFTLEQTARRPIPTARLSSARAGIVAEDDTDDESPAAPTGFAVKTVAEDPQDSVTSAVLPNVTVAITHRWSHPHISSPIGGFVRAILGAFGFKPEPTSGHTNNPLLEAIWGAYRRWESENFNALPAINDVTIAGTRFAEDGRLALDIHFDVSDYDGDPFILSARGIDPDLVETGPGTYTYFADADFTGTVPLDFGVQDFGNHRHAGPFSDPFLHQAGLTATITILAAEPTPV